MYLGPDVSWSESETSFDFEFWGALSPSDILGALNQKKKEKKRKKKKKEKRKKKEKKKKELISSFSSVVKKVLGMVWEYTTKLV